MSSPKQLYRKKFQFWANILTLVALFSACIYEPHSFYENKVDKSISSPNIQVINLNLNEDSVFAYDDYNVVFNFQTNTEKQNIKKVKLLIDDVSIDSVSNQSGNLKFMTYGLEDGIHKLSLQIVTNSGTGSIADKLGGEGYVLTNNWVLIVDKNAYNKTSAKANNGFLQLSWAQYKSSDFDCYVIFRGSYYEKEIKRTTALQYTDSSYVGEQEHYSVRVKRKDGTQLWWGGIDKIKELPTLKYEATEDNQYRVRWSKSKYYNAISKITLYINPLLSNSSTETINIEDLNDTVYTINKSFTDDINFRLRVVPKYNNILYNDVSNGYFFENNIDFDMGLPINIYYYARLYQISADEIGYTKDNVIFRYSVSKRSVVSQQTVPSYGFTIYSLNPSPNCKFFTFWSPEQTYYIYDFAKNYSYKANEYESLSGGVSQSITLSDKGTGLFIDIHDHLYHYNFVNQSILNINYIKYLSPYDNKISPNGEYAFINGDSARLIKLSGYPIKKIAAINTFYTSVKNFNFFPNDDNKLIIQIDNKIYIKRVDNFTTISEFNLNETLINVDYYNYEFLTYSGSTLRIRSLKDGTLLHELKPARSPSVDSYRLYNHRIIYYNSLIYNLP